MIYLRQSTASQEVPLGYFVDSTDGNTEETALSIANTDIKVWKTGATTLASKNSGGATHIANGIYYAVMDATDTDTIGPLKVFVHVAGALTVVLECCVLDEAVYDVMFGTTAPATATNITAGTITTVTNLTNAPTVGDLTATMKASVNTEADTALSDYGALKPTTAGRTLDVSAGGEAGVDWANVGGKTTTNDLTGTKIAGLDGTIDTFDDFVDATGKVTLAGTQAFNNTGTWTGNVTGNLSGSVGSVTGAVGSVTGNVGGNVTGSIGSLAAQAKTDVNDQVVDGLATDTYAEPTGVPGATVSLAEKIGRIYQALRNKLGTNATKKQFYDDGGSVLWEKDLADDGTDYTESEGNAP